MKLRVLFVIGIFLVGLVSGCSNSVSKGGKGSFGNSDNSDPTLCGDGALSPGESCDPALAEGEVGACPTTCAAPDSCSMASLVGSASSCDLECVIEPIACADGDGCCPTGCDATTDNDCTNVCGNGDLEAGEICDGDCPTACSPADACVSAELIGSADTCSAQCSETAITSCIDDDGCCPANCDDLDSDCTCVPDDPCATRQCGSVTNSCGTPVSCGMCSPGSTCNAAGTCETTVTLGTVGEPCNVDGDCASGECLDDQESVFVGGYCTKSCVSTVNCPTGSVCSESGDCLLSCNSDNDCTRPEYLCSSFEDVPGDVCFVAGVGNGRPGDPCTDVTDCGGGADGICFGGDPGGYCSEVCSTNTDCPSGSHCAQRGICMDSCRFDSDCRTSYACADTDFDGADECVMDANGPGRIGDFCSDSADCGGGPYATCADGANFPSGYCTIFCEPGGGTCGSGSFCSNAFQLDLCLDSCSISADCRTGYTCEDVGDGQTGCIKL